MSNSGKDLHISLNDDSVGPYSEGEGDESPTQELMQFGQVQPSPRMESRIHLVSIIGQIEGHILLPPKNKSTKYEHIIPQLVAIEQNPNIQGILLVLNTVGGDIEAGLAIAEMVRTLSKPTVALVLGGGHSIGAPIAVAANHSFIAETATITIHPIRLTGLLIGVPQTYDYLDKMQDRVVRFLVSNSNISEVKLRELMFRTGELLRDVGTVLVGAEAVNCGLIDEVGGLGQALDKLNALIREAEERKADGAGAKVSGDGAGRAADAEVEPVMRPDEPNMYPPQPYVPPGPFYPGPPRSTTPTIHPVSRGDRA